MTDAFSLTRRGFILAAAGLVAGCATSRELSGPPATNARKQAERDLAEYELGDWLIGFKPDEPYDIPLIDLTKLPRRSHRTMEVYEGREPPGTVIIDLETKHARLVLENGSAIRYGVAVGEDGKGWTGPAAVGRKAIWPGWTPTARMRNEDPTLPAFMPGGVANPMGARALYVTQRGQETLYRLHGTDEPWTIGEEDSNGCIRFLNEDILDLYGRVQTGAAIVVRRNGKLV